MHTLRDFGFGRAGSETIISYEVHLLVEFLEKRGNEEMMTPIDPKMLLSKVTANVISSLVFGERLGDDLEFVEMCRIIGQVIVPFFDSHPIVFNFAKCVSAFPCETALIYFPMILNCQCHF